MQSRKGDWIVAKANIAKTAGWLLFLGPLLDVVVSVSRPGTFPGEDPGGVQAAMQAGVHSAAENGTLFQLLVEVGFVVSFGLLIGFWFFNRLMGDSDGRVHLRRIGLMILAVALAVRTAAFAMGFLLGTTIIYAPAGALDAGPGLDTAVMFLVMEGSLGVFATILNLVGVAYFVSSVINAKLLGSSRTLNRLMATGPAVVAPFLLLLAPLLGDGIFTFYVIGNVVTLVQVAWIILLGAALIRKSGSLSLGA